MGTRGFVNPFTDFDDKKFLNISINIFLPKPTSILLERTVVELS